MYEETEITGQMVNDAMQATGLGSLSLHVFARGQNEETTFSIDPTMEYSIDMNEMIGDMMDHVQDRICQMLAVLPAPVAMHESGSVEGNIADHPVVGEIADAIHLWNRIYGEYVIEQLIEHTASLAEELAEV